MQGRAIILMIITLFILTFSGYSKTEKEGIVISQMSRESKKIFRDKLVRGMLTKFREDQTFDKIHQYMLLKATELNKKQPPHQPDFLIEDTFSKTDSLFERTRSSIKDNSDRFYEPVSFEKSVQKLLWLKGICFFVMGIKEEHQMAISYFYLPGNENVKREFLEDVVDYSFPEVPDIPENEQWHYQMIEAMSRLGYRIFSVKKFSIKNDRTEEVPLSNNF